MRRCCYRTLFLCFCDGDGGLAGELIILHVAELVCDYVSRLLYGEPVSFDV